MKEKKKEKKDDYHIHLLDIAILDIAFNMQYGRRMAQHISGY